MKYTQCIRSLALTFGFASIIASAATDSSLPAELAAAFETPREYAGQFGAFRSPLIAQDGAVVKTGAEWLMRREEIRRRWHEVMGPWPPLIESPRLVIIDRAPREDFTQCAIEIQIAPGQMARGYLLIPAGTPKFPAVFVPYYDAETSIGKGRKLRDFAYQLTKRGFVTLSIGSPGGDARQPDTGGAMCQPLSYFAYVAANCANALANLAEVDSTRIGVVGHSYGGKWAMFGSCFCDRFECAAWSDPGIVFDEKRASVNYWDPWYLGAQACPPRPPGLPDAQHARTGAYRTLIEQGMDLQEIHSLMAPRPFLVSGGAEDTPVRWIALNHAVAVNHLLGFDHRVGMTNRPAHDPTTESNEQIYQFFQHFLRSPRRVK